MAKVRKSKRYIPHPANIPFYTLKGADEQLQKRHEITTAKTYFLAEAIRNHAKELIKQGQAAATEQEARKLFRRARRCQNRARRLRACASSFSLTVQREGEVSRLVFAHPRACSLRNCPRCAQVLKRKFYHEQLLPAVNHVLECHPEAALLHLALSTRPTQPEDLAQKVRLLNDAWRKLTRMPPFKRAVLGSLRSNEITVNPRTGHLNLHTHALLVVDDVAYFKSARLETSTWIAWSEWLRMWRQAMDDEAIVNLHVSRIADPATGSTEPAAVARAVWEFASYISESVPLEARRQEQLAIMDEALLGMRMTAFSEMLSRKHRKTCGAKG